MAEVIEVKRGFEIQLTLQKEFIKRYDFENLVQHPRYYSIYIDYSSLGSFTFPFTFPPYHIDYDRPFLTTFLDLSRQLLLSAGIDPEIHLDPLLFIVNSYQQSEFQRQKENDLKDIGNKKGKLLVDLIKMPVEKITRENIKSNLPQGQEDDYVFAYLQVLTGQPDSKFKKGDEVDWSLIDAKLFKQLAEKITEANNFTIKVNENKNLVFSKDLKLKVHYEGQLKGIKPASPNFPGQNHHLILTMLETILEDVKDSNQELYRLISSEKFDAVKHAQSLDDAISDKSLYSHNAIIKRIALIICKYLHNEVLILKPKRRGQISTDQKNFLYPFFLLLGLILKEDRKISPFKTTREMEDAMVEYHSYNKLHPLFFSTKLTEAFRIA